MAVPINSPGLLSPSALSLLAANLMPLAGVLFLGWSVSSVFGAYWVETVIISLFVLVKDPIAVLYGPRPGYDNPKGHKLPVRDQRIIESFIGIIFVLVTICIYLPIFLLFVNKIAPSPAGNTTIFLPWTQSGGGIGMKAFNIPLSWDSILLVAIPFFASHLISFYSNFIRGREYETSLSNEIISRFMDRIVVMHLTIMVGGVAVLLFGLPAIAVAGLVVIKTYVDFRAHIAEHGGSQDSELLHPLELFKSKLARK